MTAKNSKTEDYHRFSLNLRNKINLKMPHRHIALSNLSIYYTCRNITKKLNNGKFKITTSSWSEEFELPEGSYTVQILIVIFSLLSKSTQKTIKMISRSTLIR